MTDHRLQGYVLAELFRETPPPGISVQPLRLPPATGPCTVAVTMVNLAVTTSYRPDFTDLDPAIRDLGIPRTAQYYAATLLEPFGMPGYRFEIVGTSATPHDPADAPRFVDQLQPDHPTTIIAWRRRVRREGIPLYLEARWSPTTPAVTFATHGLEPGLTLADLAWIPEALTLVVETHSIRPPWRPKYTSRYWKPETFAAAWPAKLAEAQRQRHGAPVQDADMARAYNVSLSTFRRYIRDYGRPSTS